MKKKCKATARVVLALMLCCSMNMNVFAAEITTGEVDVETTAGNYETVDVTITIDKTTNADGSTTIQTVTEAEDYVTEDGMIVDYEGSSNMTTDPDGVTTGEAETEYSSVNSSATYGANGGTETTIKETAPNVTIDVPLTDEDDSETEIDETQNTVKDDPAGTTNVTGDTKDYPAEGEYDYTTNTIVSQGSVTVTTTDITVTETVDGKEADLEYIHGTTEANSENDLIAREYAGNTEVDPESIQVQEGYTHVYLGNGNFSRFGAALVCRTGAEGEEPVFVDENGTAYYVQGDHSIFENRQLYVDNYYLNGEYQEKQTYARWDYVQQFVFVDAETGELITTYCADQKTSAQDGYSYIMENIEDAGYYDVEQAEMIRSVALNGYWGTESGVGSLETMKEMLVASGEFTQKEVDALTDGIAMTATQYAIWTFSNVSDGDKYINSYYVSDTLGVGRVPEEEKASVDLIFKLYNYLIDLDPTPVENTTANTIINADNFLENLSVTVVEKAEDHVNNQDADKTNDAYVTNLTFALVVTPSTENGDDLIVKVLDAEGNELASGRIAGEAKEGETVLDADEEGNYTFSNITMTEGDQNFNITLEGVQNLEQGVYLYTSEVRIDEDSQEEVSSQTMVGIAKGERAVNVSMNVCFEFSVDDEIVATERVWRDEWTAPGGDETPPSGGEEEPEEKNEEEEIHEEEVPSAETPEGEEIPDEGGDGNPDEEEIREEEVPAAGDMGESEEEVFEEEIFDEEIPLAEVPETGDISAVWMAMAALSGSGLIGLGVLSKKRKEDEE